jgi:hypothetical protein
VTTKAGEAGHEGARESTAPGTPREREVITPDWAHLDKGAAGECVTGTDANWSSPGRDESATETAPAAPKGPTIDRHR